MHRLLCGAVVAACATAASAQRTQIEPSAAVECLTPDRAARERLEFPFDEWKRGQEGSVKVTLLFTRPDAPPAVTIDASSGAAQTLAFDTTTMGCPFDVVFTDREPFMRNAVGTLGGANPARRPLLDWLQTVELDLPSRSLDAVYGDTTTVTVPCTKIDLKPKESTQ